MRYLITGASGQLGFDIKRELLSRGISESDIATPDSAELDITNMEAVENYVENRRSPSEDVLAQSSEATPGFLTAKPTDNFKPDVIFHCAAYTNVDGAETNAEICRKVNVDGTANLTKSAEKIGAKIIYISTDYVFDGENEAPYEVDAPTNPQSVYGKSKLDGELAAQKYPRHFIVRTAWVFGINGKNFVKTMLNVAHQKPQSESITAESAENPEFRPEASVVDDQIGSPTYTVDLAKFLVDLSESEKFGVYHATNEGFCSWAEFTEEIYKAADVPTKVKKVSTAEYAAIAGKPQAKRPKFSKLSKAKIATNGFEKLPTWQDAVKRYILELNEKGEL